MEAEHKKLKKRKKSNSSSFTSEKLTDLEKLVFGEDFEPDEKVSNFSDSNEAAPSLVKKKVPTKKPAWHDDDDDKLLVEEKLKQIRRKSEKLTQNRNERLDAHVKKIFLEKTACPRWAQCQTESHDEDLLQVTGDLITHSTSSLRFGTIEMEKCLDVNFEAREKNIVQNVEFHPTVQVALVAGFSGNATIFQVDGKSNAKIQSIHFRDFPVHTAHFSVDGEQIIVGSMEHTHFFYYDMMSGKSIKVPAVKGMNQKNVGHFVLSPDGKIIAVLSHSGAINLITAKTKEWVGTLKMNGEVKAVTFSKDGQRMFSHGQCGQVYTWDMNSRKCINKWTDEGCITGTALALSPNEQYLATGSDTGVVNIYEMSQSKSTNPKPAKAFMNLTTSITSLKFNHTSELLCMVSRYKDNAIKLAQLPSMTVFSNFPLFHHNFRKINCMDISQRSGYLTFGNNMGTAYLFRLKHYGNY